jgi:hypothetical protein
VEVKEKYQVKIKNRFTALRNFAVAAAAAAAADDDDDDDVDVKRAWGSMRENTMKASAIGSLDDYDLKQNMI